MTASRPGEPWSPARTLTGPDLRVWEPQLALDAAGVATIAWIHAQLFDDEVSSSSVSHIKVLTRAADGNISAPATVAAEPAGAALLRLAVNAFGVGVLAAQVGSHVHVSSRLTLDGPWEPLTALLNDASASSSAPYAVGVSASGTCHVLFWRQGPVLSSNDVACASRRFQSGAWSPLVELSAPNLDLQEGAIVFLGQDALFVYTGAFGVGGGFPGTGVMQTARWPPHALQPTEPVDLAPPGPSHDLIQVAVDNAGGAVVVERNWDTGEERLLTTAYDATPPTLVSATVPDTVAVGEVVQLRSRHVDAWSDVADVRWEFDDGSPPARGSTVTHAWPAPGPYDVRVTATDTHGNMATSTFTITAARG